MSKTVSKKALFVGLVAVVAVVSAVFVFGSDSSIFQGMMRRGVVPSRIPTKPVVVPVLETTQDEAPNLLFETSESEDTPTLSDPIFSNTTSNSTIPHEKCEEFIKLLSLGELSSTISGMDTEIRNCANSYSEEWNCANSVGNYLSRGGINPNYYKYESCRKNYPEIWGLLPPKKYECVDLAKLLAEANLTDTVAGEVPSRYLSECASENFYLWQCSDIVGNYKRFGGVNPYDVENNLYRTCANDYPEIWSQLLYN